MADPYEELKKLFTRYDSTGDEYNTPVPPPSPMRGREPQVVGPPELGKKAQEFYRMAPTLRETVKDIRVGPIPKTELMWQGGLLWQPGTILPTLGISDLGRPGLRAQVGLAPRAMQDPVQMERVLSHELAHTTGWRHEDEGAFPQDLLDMLRGRK